MYSLNLEFNTSRIVTLGGEFNNFQKNIELLFSYRLFPVCSTEIGNHGVIDILIDYLAENLLFLLRILTTIIRE